MAWLRISKKRSSMLAVDFVFVVFDDIFVDGKDTKNDFFKTYVHAVPGLINLFISCEDIILRSRRWLFFSVKSLTISKTYVHAVPGLINSFISCEDIILRSRRWLFFSVKSLTISRVRRPLTGMSSIAIRISDG